MDPISPRMTAPRIMETLKPIQKFMEEKNGRFYSFQHLDLFFKDSTNVGPKEWGAIIRAIKLNYDSFDQFLITHGTNTLGYTASALSFALENLGKPVIITGSQIPLGMPGSDAVLNLENSIRFLVSIDRLFGVFVVMASRIIPGTRAKKLSESNYDSFITYNHSKEIGRIETTVRIDRSNLEEYMALYKMPAGDKRSLKISASFDNRILSLTEFPGMLPGFIPEVVKKNNIAGIIFRSFGAGDVAENLIEDFILLKRWEVPVIVTTQAPNGIASLDLNEPGKVLFQKAGVVKAWDMSIESMTVKLSWLIGKGFSYLEILELMRENIKGELNPISNSKFLF